LPGWTWEGAHQRRWDQRFAALACYVDEHRIAALGPNTVVNRLRLGAWAEQQRTAYAAGTLPPRAIELLETIPGWHWALWPGQWEVGLETARRYVAVHHTIDMGMKVAVEDREVSRWVRRCQEKYRAGSLSSDQIAAVTALPGWRWRGQDER
jgi:hypothetical protein